MKVLDSSFWLWCPACEDTVRITTAWGYNGNADCPTFTSSIKVTGGQWNTDSSFYKPMHKVAPGETTICHSFLTDGIWHFLADCTHDKAGQAIPMVELPEWLV